MGTLTISMATFNSLLYVYQRVYVLDRRLFHGLTPVLVATRRVVQLPTITSCSARRSFLIRKRPWIREKKTLSK